MNLRNEIALTRQKDDVTKLRINKLEAARRQINCAIRMTFDGADPVAIHTVIAAGHRIIRDLCERRGDIESYLQFTDWIAPGYEKEFWKAMNASANFLKHADADFDEIHELDEEASDFLIVFATKWYRDLGNASSTEMNVFGWWWAMQHPSMLKPKVMEEFERAGVKRQVEEMRRAAQHLTRSDLCELGRLALNGQAAR
jgi:hypothetical protein